MALLMHGGQISTHTTDVLRQAIEPDQNGLLHVEQALHLGAQGVHSGLHTAQGDILIGGSWWCGWRRLRLVWSIKRELPSTRLLTVKRVWVVDFGQRVDKAGAHDWLTADVLTNSKNLSLTNWVCSLSCRLSRNKITYYQDKTKGGRKEAEGEQRSLPQHCTTEMSFKNSKWLLSKLKCSPLWTSGIEWPVIRAGGSGVQLGIDEG